MNILKLLINTLDFRHYTFSNILPDFFNNEALIWRLLGLSIVYANIIYVIGNEIKFLEPVYDVLLLYNFWAYGLASIWLFTWVFGYTALSMTFNLFYSIFSILIVLTKIYFIDSWNALAQTSFSFYNLWLVVSIILAIIIYNIMSPYWRRYYGD